MVVKAGFTVIACTFHKTFLDDNIHVNCMLRLLFMYILLFRQRALQKNYSTEVSPMLVVGQFLNDLLLNHTLPQSVYPPGRNSSSSDDFSQPLYSCPHYTQKDFLCLILRIFSGVPESYQVLRCQASTTEEELSIFLKRAENCHGQYLMLNINTLPFKLQEVSFN